MNFSFKFDILQAANDCFYFIFKPKMALLHASEKEKLTETGKLEAEAEKRNLKKWQNDVF